MQNSPNAHSSDLLYARNLSRRLRMVSQNKERERPREPVGQEAAVPRYVRFEPKHSLVETDQASTGRWTHLLEQCQHESGSLAAFLMDDQGLVIAVCGAISAERAGEIGARLQPGLDQTEQINSDSHSDQSTICVQLGERWVDATRFSHSGMRLTIGLLTNTPVPEATRANTLRLLQLASNGSNL